MDLASLLLVGCPDSGKTNYLARVWEVLRSRKGSLQCLRPPENIEYLERILTHLLKGQFAPRSDKTLEDVRSDVRIPVSYTSKADAEFEIVAPDVSGELWKAAAERLEISAEWMAEMKRSSGAILFLRVHSNLNVAPLDWVTTRQILRHEIEQPEDTDKTPTQVVLCELLRFLELTLSNTAQGHRPRVAVVVAAWDRLNAADAASGPLAYIRGQYPLLAGRLRDIEKLEIKVFGASVVGGDLQDDAEFRKLYLKSDIEKHGYIVQEVEGGASKSPDLSIPLTWLMSGT